MKVKPETIARNIETARTAGITKMAEITRLLSALRFTPDTDEQRDALRAALDAGVEIGEFMTGQAVKWLRDRHTTPTGQVRKHNPYGAREIAILADVARITWTDTYAETHGPAVPVFTVQDSAGRAFDYIIDYRRNPSGVRIIA